MGGWPDWWNMDHDTVCPKRYIHFLEGKGGGAFLFGWWCKILIHVMYLTLHILQGCFPGMGLTYFV